MNPVDQLVPGTELIATITTVTRPRTVQTTEVIRGTVWEVVGNSVMVTLESGERRQSVVPAFLKFIFPPLRGPDEDFWERPLKVMNTAMGKVISKGFVSDH